MAQGETNTAEKTPLSSAEEEEEFVDIDGDEFDKMGL